MAEGADEAAAVEVGDQGDGGIADGAAESDDYEELSDGEIRGAGGREKHARGSGNGDGSGSDEGSRAPPLEQLQKLGQLTFLEFLVEVRGAGFARDPEREVGPDNRSSRGCGGVLVPRVAVSGG